MFRTLTFLAMFVCLSSQAQVTQEIFESFKLQERRDVRYYIPEDYDKEKKYPLVVVLDAEYLFDQVVANVKFYNRFHGMPASIVVGIHQSEKSIRFDDCAWNEENGLPSEKGKLFFEFLGMEIIPYLDLNYSTAPFKMVIGYDITANYTNYWLFKENSLFNAYINISPTLAPEMESRVPSRLSAFDKQIFYELIVEAEANKNTPRILEMDKAIKAIEKENLHYNFQQYDGADHISIATYGIGKAFDNIFGMFKPISLKSIKSKYLPQKNPSFNILKTNTMVLKNCSA